MDDRATGWPSVPNGMRHFRTRRPDGRWREERSKYGSFAKTSHRGSPVGKRRLVRAEGLIARISNSRRPLGPGGGAVTSDTCLRMPAWTLPQQGLGDHRCTADEETFPPHNREMCDCQLFTNWITSPTRPRLTKLVHP